MFLLLYYSAVFAVHGIKSMLYLRIFFCWKKNIYFAIDCSSLNHWVMIVFYCSHFRVHLRSQSGLFSPDFIAKLVKEDNTVEDVEVDQRDFFTGYIEGWLLSTDVLARIRLAVAQSVPTCMLCGIIVQATRIRLWARTGRVTYFLLSYTHKKIRLSSR